MFAEFAQNEAERAARLLALLRGYDEERTGGGMKYPIKQEFGLYAHFHPPVCGALLPLINVALALLPTPWFAPYPQRLP